MSQTVIEVAVFSLLAGTSEHALLEASAKMQEAFLSKQSGYIGRRLVKEHDRKWADIVEWRTLQEAAAAEKAALSAQEAAPYFSLMDMSQLQMFHFQTIQQYSKEDSK